jgi:hypothetical protein
LAPDFGFAEITTCLACEAFIAGCLDGQARRDVLLLDR